MADTIDAIDTAETTVSSVKAFALRKAGYANFKEWVTDENNLYIGRFNRFVDGTFQSKWHNPFSLKSCNNDRELCLSKYREYIENNEDLMAELEELRGKNLGCWCKPDGCHGDVLLGLLS